MENSVYVWLMGGLGNQLFQYNYAAFLQQNGYRVKLVDNLLEENWFTRVIRWKIHEYPDMSFLSQRFEVVKLNSVIPLVAKAHLRPTFASYYGVSNSLTKNTLTQLASVVCIVLMCTPTVKANGATVQLSLGEGDVLNSWQIHGTTREASIRGSDAKTFGRLNVGLKHVTNHAVPIIEGERRREDCTKLVSGSLRAKTELGRSPDLSNLKQMITVAWRLHQTGSYKE